MNAHFQNSTFQVVAVTDGDLSFSLFSYGDIQWGEGENIGFRSLDRDFYVPGAFTAATVDIKKTSNVGVPGLYIYRVDQESIIEPRFNYTGESKVHTSISSSINERNEQL